MPKEISDEELYELYIDTLEKCGTYLLTEDDEIIGYNIFEEFDVDATSFLYIDSLERLFKAGLINKEEMEKSSLLRDMTFALRANNEWSLEAIRTSPKWKKLLELADEIKQIRKR